MGKGKRERRRKRRRRKRRTRRKKEEEEEEIRKRGRRGSSFSIPRCSEGKKKEAAFSPNSRRTLFLLRFLAHHDGLELLVVDGAGTVLVDLVHHLVHVRFRHRLVEGEQDLLQHARVDGTFSFLVENSESLSDFFLLFSLLCLLCHENQKLVEVNESRSVAVNLFDAFLKLIGFELMAQHSHDGSQFCGGNLSGSFLVDPLDRIFEIGDESIGQLVH